MTYFTISENMSRFVELLSEKYGIQPHRHPHHVIVEVGDRFGFAYAKSDGDWVSLMPYDSYGMSELHDFNVAVNEAILEYTANHAEALENWKTKAAQPAILQEVPSVEPGDALHEIVETKARIRKSREPRDNPFGGSIDSKGLGFDSDDVIMKAIRQKAED